LVVRQRLMRYPRNGAGVCCAKFRTNRHSERNTLTADNTEGTSA
jgi:hypothetical protein